MIHDLDHDAGGCCVCGRPDFALGEFCDRTMILCDQCEREFHVGCLRRDGRCDLTQLPTGAPCYDFPALFCNLYVDPCGPELHWKSTVDIVNVPSSDLSVIGNCVTRSVSASCMTTLHD